MIQRGRHSLESNASTLIVPKIKQWDSWGGRGYWRKYSPLYFQEEKSNFSFQFVLGLRHSSFSYHKIITLNFGCFSIAVSTYFLANYSSLNVQQVHNKMQSKGIIRISIRYILKFIVQCFREETHVYHNNDKWLN